MKSLARARLLVVALGLGTLVLSACAGGGASAAEAVRTTEVDLPPSYVFQPAAIEVDSGATVTWTNSDNFSHSVQIDGQSEVYMMSPGETAQITFDTPGTYPYVCTLHAQNMKGTVIVS